MKTQLALLATSPTLALAHGKHAETHSDAAHGLLHALLSLEGFAIVAALGVAVYFIVRKQP
jgi:hydrogenase/urease accessory protein HupE